MVISYILAAFNVAHNRLSVYPCIVNVILILALPLFGYFL